MVNKIDSNATGCYIAEEVIGSPKTLPGSGGADAVWYEQEPNTYSDFGGEIATVARDPLNPSRQRKRGTITDLDASGGFNSDITQNNMSRNMQGFLFASTRVKNDMAAATVTASGSIYTPDTTLGSELVTNGAFAADTDWTKGTGWTISGGDATSDASQSADSDLTQTLVLTAGRFYEVTFTATVSAGNVAAVIGGTEGTDRSSSGTYTEIIRAGSVNSLGGLRADSDFAGDIDDLSIKLIPEGEVPLVGDLLLASGYDSASNNGLKTVVGADSALIVEVAETIVDAATQTSGALLQVGFEFATSDCTMTVADGVATLGSTVKDMTEFNLNVGEWLWVGGDASSDYFATCPSGYARIASIAADAIVFDKVTSTFVTDNGSGKTIRIFFGKFLRNESNPSLIVTRTYNIERQLGNDGNGIQAEYLEGAVANELTLNIPQADKLNADLAYVAMDETFKTGSEGVKVGTRVAALGEDPYNTSRNIYRLRMNIIDAATLEPTALFAYVTEATITINNNASLAKAVSVLGGFDITVGTFEVGGSLTAYFTSVAASAAIRNNSDVTMDIILAKDNAGLVYDMPMFGLGGGRINVEKDQAITIPLETLAAEGAAGYTLGVTELPYLPTAAMPT